MTSTSQCIASLARLSLQATRRPTASSIPRFLAPSLSQTRNATVIKSKKDTRKKKQHKEFRQYNLSNLEQFSLCDAMRYIRAYEVGRPPPSVKYSVALKLKSLKNGPIIRNRIRLPHPVKDDIRVAVICKEEGGPANEAKAAGAVVWGEDSLFNFIKENPGNLPFNRLICHTDSVAAMNKAGLGRILGPKGLMPSLKTKTISNNVRALMREFVGTENYKERQGVIRLAVGSLSFNPQMLADNVKTLVGQVKKDISDMEDQIPKDLVEVVLSSTNGPGFSLNGSFNPSDNSITPGDLSTAM